MLSKSDRFAEHLGLLGAAGRAAAYAPNLMHRLRTNSLMLHGIKHKRDVSLLPDDRRENMRLAIKACEFLVASIGSGEQSKNSEYGQ
jgi:hypothetical protein